MAFPFPHWGRRGIVAVLLWPLSLLFGIVVSLRRAAHRHGWRDTRRVDAPVLVVGNLVMGGSGKTPLALWIAQFLHANGHRPVLLSRGYGRRDSSVREVRAEDSSADVGDEPLLLARRSGVPVWVGADRAAAADAARNAHPEVSVFVLDDGLQHYRLARDTEIALVDRRGLGNGWLFPAGPLREPPARLAKVDAVIDHDGDLARLPAIAGLRLPRAFRMKLSGERIVRLAQPEHGETIGDWRGREVHAVAGIGDPERFFLMLEKAGLRLHRHPFPDHHAFAAAELAFPDALPILLTEKDALRFPRRPPAELSTIMERIWYLPVEAAIDAAFGNWLLSRLAERLPSAAAPEHRGANTR